MQKNFPAHAHRVGKGAKIRSRQKIPPFLEGKAREAREPQAGTGFVLFLHGLKVGLPTFKP
jgi:hypothetical protein